MYNEKTNSRNMVLYGLKVRQIRVKEMEDRAQRLYREWMEDPRYDDASKKELQAIAGCE